LIFFSVENVEIFGLVKTTLKAKDSEESEEIAILE